MREAKNPQLEMAKQPQIKRRIQANMSLFHFISLAEQFGHCNRRQAAVCFPKSKIKRRRRGEYIFTTTHDQFSYYVKYLGLRKNQVGSQVPLYKIKFAVSQGWFTSRRKHKVFKQNRMMKNISFLMFMFVSHQFMSNFRLCLC